MVTRRKGLGLVYAMVVMVGLLAIGSLAVDLGRVQIVKTQLRAAADAAARAAAHELPKSQGTARLSAIYYAGQNNADGKSVALNLTEDIKFGKWDLTSRTFTEIATSDNSKLNAVRIIARRTKARGNPVPMMLANVIGFGTCDVTAESIVMIVPEVNVDQYVPATANPFLAGMPKGTPASMNNPHNSPDYAGDAADPKQSPLVVKLPITDGDVLNFDSISGDARHDPNLAYYQPDGELTDIGRNTNGAENGISDMKAPINALVGVFINDNAPNKMTAPSSLDFSSTNSRNFEKLQPGLQQLFFIGDGRTDSGKPQDFVAPKGATRLFVATWDFFEWNNNAGFRNIKIYRPERIITVK